MVLLCHCFPVSSGHGTLLPSKIFCETPITIPTSEAKKARPQTHNDNNKYFFLKTRIHKNIWKEKSHFMYNKNEP